MLDYTQTAACDSDSSPLDHKRCQCPLSSRTWEALMDQSASEQLLCICLPTVREKKEKTVFVT